MHALLLFAVQNPLTDTFAPRAELQEMLVGPLLAAILGILLAAVYRGTHKGLSYSQSFCQTIVFVAVITAVVMLVINNNLARAFALVGALSIIRFRTVVKDTRDTAFVFAGLAVGMAAGTGENNYMLAVIGTVSVSLLALGFHATNFGALYKSEFILRFRFDQSQDSSAYLQKIQQYSRRSNILHIEPSGDSASLKLTYDINLEKDATAQQLTQALGEVHGVSEVILIVAKNDIDY